MTTNVAYQVSAKGLSIVISGRTTFLERNHVNYDKAKELIIAKDMDGLVDLVAAKSSVLNETALASFEGVEVFRSSAYYNGVELKGRLLDRMVETATEGLPIEPLVKLLQNIRENPSYRCVQDFFTWLDKNHLAYTEDGHFLAYKIVTENFLDCHSRTFDNSPGKVVKVTRNEVDDNPDVTCSKGLHGCGAEYLPHYGSWVGAHKVICIKVNPAHLVAFPTDYKHSKFRCCEYTVVEEIARDVAATYFSQTPTYAPTNDLEDVDDTHDEDVDEDEDEDDGDTAESVDFLEIIEGRATEDSDWEKLDGDVHGCTTRSECEEWVQFENDSLGEILYRIKPEDGDDGEESGADDWPYNIVGGDDGSPETFQPTDEPSPPAEPETPAEAPEAPEEPAPPPTDSAVAADEPAPLVPTGPVMSGVPVDEIDNPVLSLKEQTILAMTKDRIPTIAQEAPPPSEPLSEASEKLLDDAKAIYEAARPEATAPTEETPKTPVVVESAPVATPVINPFTGNVMHDAFKPTT